jgi:HAD superfamily hydrolase (TIGR01509 family)
MQINTFDFSKIAALFDLDGVILDTESQYTIFWEQVGLDYLGKAGFGTLIKGQTLVNIFQNHFPDESQHEKITKALYDFEANMNLPYIPGAKEFILALKKAGVKLAVVTSSNQEKMANVYKKIPGFTALFDKILTAEMFAKGKPAPDCYLLGAEVFQADIKNCVVFEDSFHGLEAGRSAGMKVVGLATTNPKEKIAHLSDIVIEDFTQFDINNMMDLIQN